MTGRVGKFTHTCYTCETSGFVIGRGEKIMHTAVLM